MIENNTTEPLLYCLFFLKGIDPCYPGAVNRLFGHAGINGVFIEQCPPTTTGDDNRICWGDVVITTLSVAER